MRVLIDGQSLSTPEAHRGIGIATRRLVEHLVLHDPATEWLVSASKPEALEVLPPEVRARVEPVIIEGLSPAEDPRAASRRYTAALEDAAARHGVDVYWNTNPLMLNVVLPGQLERLRYVATVYDLIPWIMRDLYLDCWPPAMRAEYERRLQALPVVADHLAFISAASQRDFLAIDRSAEAKTSVIHLGVDHTRFRPSLGGRPVDTDPFVLYTGGFDARKNMDRALVAFADLVTRHPTAHPQLRFCVVCSAGDAERNEFFARADELGVADRVILTGYVDEGELAELYRKASVFFFPSLYEGFGLPVLEALASGTPVVASDTSSVPEIAGEHAIYFAADDTKSMARGLAKGLGRADDESRRLAGIQHARSFSWQAAAASYAQMFDACHRSAAVARVRRRPQVACVTPWPPQRTAVAHYAMQLVAKLDADVDVTVYVQRPERCDTTTADFEVRPLTALPDECEQYDSIVYHIGNNSRFYRTIYQLAWEIPGIVFLHDYNLNPFLTDAFLGTPQEDLYYAAAHEGHGIAREAIPEGGLDPLHYPLSIALARRSRATIVSNAWLRDQLVDVGKVHVVPPPPLRTAPQRQDETTEQLRTRLGIDSSEMVVTTLGFVNRLKRVPQVLDAVKALCDHGFPVRLFIAGALVDPTLEIEQRIEQLGLSERVIVSGYLNEADLDAAIAISDVIVNLRCPSMGESSHLLLRAMAHGKACVVSNHLEYAVLPPDVVWHVDVDELETSQLVACLERLLCDRHLRHQLSRNARQYVERYHTLEGAAQRLLHCIETADDVQASPIEESLAQRISIEPDLEPAPEFPDNEVAPLATLPAARAPRRSLVARTLRFLLRPAWWLLKRGLRPLIVRFDAHLVRVVRGALHDPPETRAATLPHVVAVRDELVQHIGELNRVLTSIHRRVGERPPIRELEERLDAYTLEIARLERQIESLRQSFDAATPHSEASIRAMRRKDRRYLARHRAGHRDAA